MSELAKVKIEAECEVELAGDRMPTEDEVRGVADELLSDILMRLADLGTSASGGPISVEVTHGDRGVKGALG